jgi:hypothetical protein
MRTSVDRYHIPKDNPRPGAISEQARFGSFTLKDIDTWRTVKSNEIEGVVSLLHPAIVRLGVGDRSEVELVKPVVIVTVEGGSIPISQLRRRARTGDPREVYSDVERSEAANIHRSPTDIDQIWKAERRGSGGSRPSSSPDTRRHRSETPSLMSLTRHMFN